MMSVEFWYVRHGETLFNRMRRYQGQCDSPLTEKGIGDAQRAGAALKDTVFTRAYCSFSGRAEDTAEIVLGERELVPVRKKGLMEHYVGLAEGALIDDPVTRRVIEYGNSTGDWSHVEGESIPDMKKRIRHTLEEIAGECTDGDRVLIVSHGSYCMYLMEEMLGVDIDALRKANGGKLPVPNGSILRFAYDNGTWILRQLPKDPDCYTEP